MTFGHTTLDSRVRENDGAVSQCTRASLAIVDEGVVSRASDVDVVWLAGYGFPRYRGGPLFYADRLGAKHVLERMRALRERFGAAYWTPAPALERLAAARRGFYST